MSRKREFRLAKGTEFPPSQEIVVSHLAPGDAAADHEYIAIDHWVIVIHVILHSHVTVWQAVVGPVGAV